MIFNSLAKELLDGNFGKIKIVADAALKEIKNDID